MEPIVSVGNGNMGTATDPTSRCRYGLTDRRWGLEFIRGTFKGGTGNADLAIKLAHRNGVTVFTLHTLKDVGTDGSQVNLRILPEEARAWEFEPEDKIVLEWTNPNTQEWTIEVGLKDGT